MVLKHLHIVPEIPSNLNGNVKNHLFRAHSDMMDKAGKYTLTHLRLSDDLHDSDLRKRYSVIFAETEKNVRLEEKFTHQTQEGIPITFYNFSYDSSVEEDFVLMGTGDEDTKLAETLGKVLELQDQDHVSKSLWNRFLDMAKSFVNLMANLANPLISGIVKLVSFLCNTWKHIKPVVVDWLFQGWGICGKLSSVVPVGATTDEIAAIAGQLESSKKGGFLSYFLDRLPQISPVITKVLLWVGSVLSIVDTAYAVKKTCDAKEVHRKCAEDVIPISDYLTKAAVEAGSIAEILSSCDDRFLYDTLLAQAKRTALSRREDLSQFSSRHVAKARQVQEARSDTSVWAIGRISIELIAALSGLIVGNVAATLIQLFMNICRYCTNLATYYFETCTVSIIKAVVDAQTLLANQGFMDFIEPLKTTHVPATAKEMQSYATKLKDHHETIQKASSVTLYGFLECTLTLFKTSLVALYESALGILAAMKDAAFWAMDRAAEGVDYVCERVKKISSQIWAWLSQMFS